MEREQMKRKAKDEKWKKGSQAAIRFNQQRVFSFSPACTRTRECFVMKKKQDLFSDMFLAIYQIARLPFPEHFSD